MFRTRFRNEIVAEFLPPVQRTKNQKLILLCDGMPSIPRKQSLAEFLAARGFWVIYPRYRGSWESGGEFLKRSPHEDLLDVLNELPGQVADIAFGERFHISPKEIYVIGGSFGGAAAILLSLDSRVRRAIANCPVVDWQFWMRRRKSRPPTEAMQSTSARRSVMLIGSRIVTGTSFAVATSTTRGITGPRSSHRSS